MRQPDPQWQSLAAEPFGHWIDENVIKYQADKIRVLMKLRDELPPSGAVEIEIGSNRGRFISGLCLSRPEVNFIGIEIKRGLCEVASRRLEKQGLDNGRVIVADAKLAIPILFSKRPLDSVFVLFPDPWWKERHARRRLLDAPFMKMLHAHLRPGGTLIVMTDVLSYAENVREELKKIPGLYTSISKEEVPGSEGWHLTTRERYCEKDEVPVERMYLQTSPKQ